MAKREGGHWGVKAALCAAIILWQVCDMATASVLSPADNGYMRYLIVGVALIGLVASLLKRAETHLSAASSLSSDRYQREQFHRLTRDLRSIGSVVRRSSALESEGR